MKPRISKIAALCLSLVVLLGLSMAGFGVYFITLGNEARNWPAVEGEVISTRIFIDISIATTTGITESQRERERRYYPSVTYQWSVDGRVYTGSRYRLSDTYEKFKTRAAAVVAASRFKTGAPVRVYYDPAHPDQAVLETAVSAGVHVPLWLGLLIFVMGWLGFRYYPHLPSNQGV